MSLTKPSTGGGGGGPEVNYPQVNSFGDLPAANTVTGEVYLVLSPSGIWFITRKDAGLYVSDGTNWNYLGYAFAPNPGAPDTFAGFGSSGQLESTPWARNALGGVSRSPNLFLAPAPGDRVIDYFNLNLAPTADAPSDNYEIRREGVSIGGAFDVGNFYNYNGYVVKSGAGDAGSLINFGISAEMTEGTVQSITNLALNAVAGQVGNVTTSTQVVPIDSYMTLRDGHTTGIAYGLRVNTAHNENSTATNAGAAYIYSNILGNIANGYQTGLFATDFGATAVIGSGATVLSSYANVAAGCSFTGDLIGVQTNSNINAAVNGYIGHNISAGGNVAPSYVQGVNVQANYADILDSYTGVQVGHGMAEVLNFTGINVNTNTGTDGDNWYGVAVNGVVGTLTNYMAGFQAYLSGDVQNCAGIFIDVTGVNASSSKYAAWLKGDVLIEGSLTFTGAFSIGQLNAFYGQEFTAGPFPTSIHSMISSFNALASTTYTGVDSIGVNTACLLNFGANSAVTSNFLGQVALGLPAVVNMSTGSTVDNVAGAAFAISLDATATGGTIGVLSLCKALAIPNGVTAITELRGYDFQLPFGDPGTDTWGVYIGPSVWNYFNKSLAIGTTNRKTGVGFGLEVQGATKFGDVNGADWTEFEADGTLKMVGAATVYNDMHITGAALTPGGAAAPDLINFVDANCQAYAFDGGGTTERLYTSIEFQHDYMEGTDLELHLHWAPTTATSGDVIWQAYYTIANMITGTYSAPTLLTATASAAGGTAWKHNYKTLGVISGAGRKIGDVLLLQVFRDPGATGDTYTDDAVLLSLGIHYQCDTLGSRTATGK